MELSTDNEAQPSLTAPPTSRIDLRAYWRVVRKRWLAIVAVTVVALAVSFVYTFRQPKIYEAVCQIVIEPTTPQVLQGVKDVVELGTGTLWANKEFFETQYRIIQSTAVAQRVADKLGVTASEPRPGARAPADSGKAADPKSVAPALLGQIRVKGVKDSRIASIVAEDTNPARAALVANTFAETYIEYNLDYKLEGARAATAWLGEQEDDFKRRLRESEIALYEFRKKRNLLAVGLDDKQNMTNENLQNVAGELAKVQLKRIETESQRKLIQAAREDMSQAETLPEVQTSDLVKSLRQNYNQLAKEQAEFSAKYGPEHPRMKVIVSQLEVLKTAYQKEIDGVLEAFENRYRALVEQEKALLRAMEIEKKQAIELSALEVEYKPLARTAEENLKLYRMISTRQREIDLTGLLRTNNVRILERAVVPGAPVRPKPVQNLAMAVLVGLGLGVGLAFLIEAVDNTLKSPADVEALLGVPVLGIIPVIGGKDEKITTAEGMRERDLGIFVDPKSVAAECCRSIRTNVLFMSPDHPPRTIVVTSPSPQEGKTTTATNLAITMAEAGGRVLVIDTDMRKPRLHRSFGVPNQAGISTVIVGASNLDDVIKRTEVPNLDVLPCGPIPPNPSELLHTERFAQLLRECEARYERIILDSPPTSAVTDPAVLGNLADGVILIVKGGQTTRESALLARRQLQAANAKVLGVIVNEIDLSNPAYGYHYYYYRTYERYGYTYGQGPEENRASS